ncbi:MAG: penicillin-binding transpeptidase domain-containing protein [Christensenellaceae bacterium]
MLNKLKVRFLICFSIIIILFVTLTVGVSGLTLAQGGELVSQSEDKKIRTLSLKGSRGQIMDAAGIPLAYDQPSFNVEFVKDPSKNTTTDKSYYTDVLIDAISLIEKNGSATIDTFSIKRQEDGTFKFDFGDISKEAHAKREKDWRENMFVSKKAAPDVIYRDLRTRYRIPEEYTYEQARKLLSIWQEVQLSSYRAFIPVQIAKDVNMETVALIEAYSNELDGVQIAQSAMRIYPKDDVAAHIVGYMGKMTNEDTIKEMQAKGYSQEDMIGVTGVESSMESYLTGNSTEKQGQRQVEVNSKGKVIKELSYTPAKPGDNVMLTIDLQMQMVAEQALKKNIEEVYQLQVKAYNKIPAEYDEKLANRKGDTALDKLNLAKTGATVVMEAKTGRVLAMASYPSYDLNIFTGGISEEDMKMLNDDKSTPLFNKAISSNGIPGSIFKMVTGMAGLVEGSITLDTIINDEGDYNKDVKSGKAPACWTTDISTHQNQTIIQGLKNSCNYFFYEVADRLTNEKLVEWGEKFGLTTATGIEIPGETVGQIGSQKVLYDPDKPLAEQKTSRAYLVRNKIIEDLTRYGKERGIEYKKEQMETTADKLLKLAGRGKIELGPDVRTILYEELEIPAGTTSNKGWDNEISTRLSELTWKPVQTAVAGIGSEITTITPIAAARYVASLVNGGYVYEAHVVDSIVDANGNIVEKKEPKVFNKIDAPQSYFDAIKEGMKEVTSAEDGGTAGDYFKDWKYKDQIGAKTGSGKVSNIDLENNAWFVAFAPYDDPEIVVISYIPNGQAGGYAIPMTKDIIEYYLDGKEQKVVNEIPTYNMLLP